MSMVENSTTGAAPWLLEIIIYGQEGVGLSNQMIENYHYDHKSWMINFLLLVGFIVSLKDTQT